MNPQKIARVTGERFITIPPKPYFGICSPIPRRGYARYTRNKGYERYRVMADNLDQPMVYQIRVEGHLGPRWKDWFGGMTIALEDNGETLLTGPVADQAALHGLLRKVRDLGLSLISAIRVKPPRRTPPRSNSQPRGDER